MKGSSLITPLITSLLLLVSNAANSEIFKWVDENGKSHFTDTPPPNTQTEEVTLKINTYSAAEITPLVERLGKPDKVVIYSAEWCKICDKAKKYFRINNIAYVSYDVEKSRTGRIDYKLLRGRAVPIIIVGKKRMNGFSVSKFSKLYDNYLKKQVKEKLNEG